MSDLANLIEGTKPDRRTGNYTKGGLTAGKKVSGFACPFCDHDITRIVDTYKTGSGPHFKRNGFIGLSRRRKCEKCEIVFTTQEKVPTRDTLMVVKRDGSREPFESEQIMRSILEALADRQVSKERLYRVVNSIEVAAQPKQKNGSDDMVSTRYRSITSHEIGALVMNSLKELDEVAYIRFASTFLRFKSKEYFQQLLDTMQPHPVQVS